MRISKEQVLAGTKVRKDISIRIEKNKTWDLTIRPLSDAEMARVQSRALAGQRVEVSDVTQNGDVPQTVSMDMGMIAESSFEADCLAVSLGIVDEDPWTPEDVSKIPWSGVVSRIASAVYDLTGSNPYEGMDEEAMQRLRRFREVGGGADDRSSDDEGKSSSGEHAGRSHADAASGAGGGAD